MLRAVYLIVTEAQSCSGTTSFGPHSGSPLKCSARLDNTMCTRWIAAIAWKAELTGRVD
jgi:hypothetical protein